MITVRLSNGTLRNTPMGVSYRSNDGYSQVLFEGVQLRTSRYFIAPFTAYQWCGVIHVSTSWISQGFSVQDFTHEYGHYLQQKTLGTLQFLLHVALPSMWSLIIRPRQHFSASYERDATFLGLTYFEQHNRKSHLS